MGLCHGADKNGNTVQRQGLIKHCQKHTHHRATHTLQCLHTCTCNLATVGNSRDPLSRFANEFVPTRLGRYIMDSIDRISIFGLQL